jgi:hypothetical protein
MIETEIDSQAVIERNGEVYRSYMRDKNITAKSFSEVFAKTKDRLPNVGGKIEIGSGTFVVDSTLEIDFPLRLYGVGAGNTSRVDDMTILQASPDLSGAVVEVTGKNAPTETMHGTGIFDLGIVGHKGGDQTDCLLLNEADSVNLSNMFFERLLLDSANRDGMNIEHAKKHIQLRDVWIGHNNRNALSIQSGYRYWITNSYFYDSRNGLNVSEGASDISIVSPHCRKNERAGMKISSDRYQLFGGRSVNNKFGIEVYGANGMITGGEFLNNTVGIVLGDDSTGPTNTQVYLNRIGTGLRGKHRSATETGARTDNKVKRFAEITKDSGFGEAAKRSAKYMFRQSKEAVSSEKEKRTIGIQVSDAASDTNIVGSNYFGVDTEMIDEGERTLIENTAEIDQDPRKSEEWTHRAKEGTTVRNESNSELYVYIGGSWRRT